MVVNVWGVGEKVRKEERKNLCATVFPFAEGAFRRKERPHMEARESRDPGTLECSL